MELVERPGAAFHETINTTRPAKYPTPANSSFPGAGREEGGDICQTLSELSLGLTHGDFLLVVTTHIYLSFQRERGRCRE